MQTKFSSAVLGNDRFGLPLPGAIGATAAPSRAERKVVSASLTAAGSKRQRAGLGMEEIAWLVLAASSLAMLVVAMQ